MKKKVCLLLLAGVLILIGTVLAPSLTVLFKISTEPKPVEISEADFIKLLESHQKLLGSLAVVEFEGGGKISHSVTGSYKNPNPPGNEIRFETAWVDGPAADLNALVKKYDPYIPSLRRARPTLASMPIRMLPVALFLLVAWYLFRREFSSIFRPKA